MSQVRRNVGYGNALEVVNLATAQDSGYHLVLLRRGQDEDHIRRRLLQRLQEGIESLRRKHVHLVDDEDAVTPHLRRDVHLVCEVAYVVHAVVGGGVELDDVERGASFYVAACLALAACLAICRGVKAVDGLGEDTRARSLAHPARPAEQVRLRQAPRADGILQRRS